MKITHSAGFTIIEVLTTMIIIGTFMTFFFQMYLVVESQRISVQRSTEENDIAYANLAKYSRRPNIPASMCDDNMDMTKHVGGVTPGMTIGAYVNGTVLSAYQGFNFVPETGPLVTQLGKTTSQQVQIYAPNGCGANFYLYPLLIASIVQDPTKNEFISHTAYVSDF